MRSSRKVIHQQTSTSESPPRRYRQPPAASRATTRAKILSASIGELPGGQIDELAERFSAFAEVEAELAIQAFVDRFGVKAGEIGAEQRPLDPRPVRSVDGVEARFKRLRPADGPLAVAVSIGLDSSDVSGLTGTAVIGPVSSVGSGLIT